jgi:hypothetical protein
VCFLLVCVEVSFSFVNQEKYIPCPSLLSVDSTGDQRDAWKNLILSAMVGVSMAAFREWQGVALLGVF